MAASPSLDRWINDSDAKRLLDQFGVEQGDLQLRYLGERADDYYIALVGEFFDYMRSGTAEPADWSRLANAMSQFAERGRLDELRTIGVNAAEALTYASAAFYFGGFPASACLVLRHAPRPGKDDVMGAVYDLLARPQDFGSRIARDLIAALARGDMGFIAQSFLRAWFMERGAVRESPEAWVAAKMLRHTLQHFRRSNLRTILPEGHTEFWSPLVASMLARRPAVFEFFPSQIEAIRAGLLTSKLSFSLQMPTGAGKTALCETLLFHHAKTNPRAAAILLVPYRSLASELRRSLVPRLRAMGVTSGCSYGGTVPSREEVQSLDATQVLVATPETLAGMLTADEAFLNRVSLVICDEGHLLDTQGRGIALELLIARFKARAEGSPRFVFVSAIVPNIEEINTWLGGTKESVVKSAYRPSRAEFALIKSAGQSAGAGANLVAHPEEREPTRFVIPGFLSRADFAYRNAATDRTKTLPFASFKTRAVAAARKAMSMGTVALFAANKRGNQGAIGIAEEILYQLSLGLPLPNPIDFADRAQISLVHQYVAAEYGDNWIGTQCISAGVVLHHGDIPQETREVFEKTLRDGHSQVAICTSTLAEGVNLPIRTLVLYSVERRDGEGKAVSLLARDIKNLVGRAGRAGATTRGLVICANENQWSIIAPVAQQKDGEPVIGALKRLLVRVQRSLALRPRTVDNTLLERSSNFFPVVDGIDSALVDLIAEEVGDDQLAVLAQQIADHTFAAATLDAQTKKVLDDIVRLRSARIAGLRSAKRLSWIKETGAKVRIVESVETSLLASRPAWDDVADATEDSFVSLVLSWAWNHREVQIAVQEAYRVDEKETESVRAQLFLIVKLWLAGETHGAIAAKSALSVDDLLGVLTRVVNFNLQTMVEQGISLLEKLLEEQGRAISAAVKRFPNHLKYGIPTRSGLALATAGVRHRSAAVLLGGVISAHGIAPDDPEIAAFLAHGELESNAQEWRRRLGTLVFEHTKNDVAQ